MGNECRLCGGKLRNGICVECGLDNRKSDEMYKHVVNQSDCDNKDLTHVHEEEEPKRNQKPRKEISRHQTSSVFQPKKFVVSSTNRNRKASILTIGVVMLLVFITFFGIAASQEQSSSVTYLGDDYEPDFKWDYDGDSGYEWDYDEDFDFYGEITEELNPEGEYWNQEMSAGIYVVGVDIPEGEYTLYGREGSAYGVFDSKHYLAVTENFGTEEYDIRWAEGVKLFEGAIICVDGFYPVEFISENAQIQALKERIQNPLTESREISGTAVAGEDFPAGTYDVTAVSEEFGIFAYELEIEKEEYSLPFAFSTLMEKNATGEYPRYCSVYKNVVLPEGTVITAEDLTIKLMPSQGIISEDYSAFYDNAY